MLYVFESFIVHSLSTIYTVFVPLLEAMFALSIGL
jgi:hypothetical protein